MQSAGGLRAAFDDVAGEAAGGQQIVVGRRPAELVDQRAERHRAVDAAAGNDDVGARVERLRDGEGAEVGIGAEDALAEAARR